MAILLSLDSKPLLEGLVRSNEVGILRELLQRDGLYINSIDSSGRTLLHYACWKGYLDVVGMLVSEFKADVTIQDKDGVTALMLAARAGHNSIVRALLSDYQCPVNTTDEQGYDVLYYACAKHTPFHKAASLGKETLLRYFFCEFGYGVNSRKSTLKRTPLVWKGMTV